MASTEGTCTDLRKHNVKNHFDQTVKSVTLSIKKLINRPHGISDKYYDAFDVLEVYNGKKFSQLLKAAHVLLNRKLLEAKEFRHSKLESFEKFRVFKVKNHEEALFDAQVDEFKSIRYNVREYTEYVPYGLDQLDMDFLDLSSLNDVSSSHYSEGGGKTLVDIANVLPKEEAYNSSDYSIGGNYIYI